MSRNLLRLILILTLLIVFFAACSPAPKEEPPGVKKEDIIGRWQSTTLPDLWVEFRADMTSTGGAWALTKDGLKVISEDGSEHLAVLKDGKLIFAEFGQHGVFEKEQRKK
jgi:hypothetical protein